MNGVKGFSADWKCRGHQFEVGKEYIHEGPLELCAKDYHFVENPIDVFDYYAPGESKYAEVSAEGVSDHKSGDSKRVCSKLKVVAELSLHALCGLAAKFTLDRVDWKNAKESCAVSLGIKANTFYVLKRGKFVKLLEAR